MSLSLRKLEAEGAGRPRVKHGVVQYLKHGRLPSGKAWLREQKRIAQLQAQLIKQYGGDAIRPDVEALITSAVEALTIQRLSMLYVRKGGIFRRDGIEKGVLELHPVLAGQFTSYAAAVRLNLEAAARLAGQKAPGTEPIDVTAYVEAVDASRKDTGGGEFGPENATQSDIGGQGEAVDG